MSDGRKYNGGHSTKGRAGRKPKAEEHQLIEKLDKAIDQEKAIEKLNEMVENGDFKALQLYLAYRYGKPRETKDVNLTGDLPIFDL